MEIGNLLFGNSRGEHEVDRGFYEQAFMPLWASSVFFSDGFENDVFVVRPYSWAECLCDGACACVAGLPNFEHKSTGFSVSWYKYPFRDSYSNKVITEEELRSIVRSCVASISRPSKDPT